MDDLDLATRLDRSIGSTPDGGAPLPTLIAEGRRVIRRRRLRTAAASLAAVVVVAGGASAFVDRSVPAPDPTSTTQRSDLVAPGVVKAPVSYTRSGQLRIRAGLRVLMRIENPYTGNGAVRSVAMVLEDSDGERIWAMAYLDWPISGTASADPRTIGGSFQSWVAQSAVAGQRLSSARTSLVRFEVGGFTPLLGVTVLEQRDDVDLGPSFSSSDDDVAAAEVRSPGGDVYYVLGRQGPGLEPWVYVVTQAEGGADLDAFLDYARERWGGDRAE